VTEVEETPEERFDFIPEVVSIPGENEEGLLRLTVGVNREEDEWTSYYRLSVTVLGRFEWIDPDPSISRKEFTSYYLKSGLSMLYGIIREKIVTLCASSPYPRMMIPTITFEEIVEDISSEYELEDGTSGMSSE